MGSLRQRLLGNSFRAIYLLDRFLRPKHALKDLSDVKNLLFLTYYPALGSAVHVTPLFEAIKSELPGTRLVVASSGLPYQVLKHNPYLDFVLQTPNPSKDLRAAARAIRQSIPRLDFPIDCVATSALDQRTRISLLGYLVGGYYRVGATIHPQLYDRAQSLIRAGSEIELNLGFLELFHRHPGKYEPRVYFSPDALNAARHLLVGEGAENGRGRAVLITQTSGTQPTAWYDNRFAEIAEYLYKELDCNVVLVGTAQESRKIDELRAKMALPTISLAGRTDIPTLAAVLCLCDFAVTLDTGVMHVGRAVRLPMVLISSAWERPERWLPLNNPLITILRRDVRTCTDCGNAQCTTRACMDEISADAVKHALVQLARKYPPCEASRQTRVDHSLNAL